VKLAAVAILALVVAGCGGSGTRVIAWTGQRPPIAPAPPLARPCRASDLKLRSLEGDWLGAGGDLVGVLRVTNASRSPCSLLGRPRVGFMGPYGVSVELASFTGMRSSLVGGSGAFNGRMIQVP
jgi:hypothetical protein